MNHRESSYSKRDEYFNDEIKNKKISILFVRKKISFSIKASNTISRPEIAHLLIWGQGSGNNRA